MMHKLLATTALVALLSSGAYAQDATAPAPPPAPAAGNAAPAAPVMRADGSLASNIVGENVYDGAGDDAENIGKVSDVVFDKDGQATQLVVGVGGFLGVGTKNVAIDYGSLKWAEKNGDRWLVADTSKDALKALPDFDDTPYKPALPQASDGTQAPAPAPDATTGQAPATTPTTTPGMGMATETPAVPADMSRGMLASTVIGETVYNGTGDDAEKIGSVDDIVLDKQGKAQQFVIGVGGFLGVGAKDVAFDYDKAQWAEKNGDRWMVVASTKEQLQGLPAFDRKAYDPAPAVTAAGGDTPAEVRPTTDAAGKAAPAADGTDATETAATGKSTMTEIPAGKISADTLIGTTVYGADDVKVGEIGDVVLSTDNRIDAIVVDVGGFLGIGSKPVAIGMDKLKFLAGKDGKQYLYTNFTKDQLEAQAAYDKGSYADKRDEQRMILR